MKRHPIQLQNVFVDELSLVVLDRFGFKNGEWDKGFTYGLSRTEFDKENSTIAIKVELAIEPEDPEIIDRPFVAKVSLFGVFKVDQSQFPVDKIEQFAEINAPIILLPYVREHIFGLTARSGFDPVILPLIEVPTIKISAPEKPDE
ncbi:protein-export chaperone SecB [Pseudomonas solani]|uniref:protein-export chaperone SecB n=1 Tax=Pseudomonas solani TaxID=2731552 RepID=UPI0035BE14B9